MYIYILYMFMYLYIYMCINKIIINLGRESAAAGGRTGAESCVPLRLPFRSCKGSGLRVQGSGFRVQG